MGCTPRTPDLEASDLAALRYTQGSRIRPPPPPPSQSQPGPQPPPPALPKGRKRPFRQAVGVIIGRFTEMGFIRCLEIAPAWIPECPRITLYIDVKVPRLRITRAAAPEVSIHRHKPSTNRVIVFVGYPFPSPRRTNFDRPGCADATRHGTRARCAARFPCPVSRTACGSAPRTASPGDTTPLAGLHLLLDCWPSMTVSAGQR